MKKIMIELKEATKPEWMGMISIFEKTGNREYTTLHVGMVNKECFEKLRELLGGSEAKSIRKVRGVEEESPQSNEGILEEKEGKEIVRWFR
jgi:hypothetical protein